MTWHWQWLLVLLVLFDMQNLLACVRRSVTVDEWFRISRDFTIMVPIYGAPRYLRNLGFLSRYPRENVLLIVDVAEPEMAAFAEQLSEDGWQVHRTTFTHRTAPSEMLMDGIRSVRTTWAVRMDGDSWSRQDIGKAITALEVHGSDFASSRVLPSRRRTVAECLQGVEYELAMTARRIRPWATSGACIIARTSVYRHILSFHSMWFYGEDVETGIIGKFLGYKSDHLKNLLIYTDVPETFRAVFKQRLGWWSGYFRTWVVNIDKLALRFPTWAAYTTGLVIVGVGSKVESAVTALTLIPFIILVYTVATYAANWQARSKWFIAFPYYALVQAILMPLIGAAYYLYLAIRYRQWGRFRVGMAMPIQRTATPRARA